MTIELNSDYLNTKCILKGYTVEKYEDTFVR